MRERQGECAAELAIANVGSATGQPDTAWTWEQSDERGRRLQDQCSQLQASGSMVLRGWRAEITTWSRQANCVTPCAVRNALRDRPGAGAATATSGFEVRTPWADIGKSGLGGTFRMMAAIIRPDGFIGRHVCVLTAGGVPAGVRTIMWDGHGTAARSAPPGLPGACLEWGADVEPARRVGAVASGPEAAAAPDGGRDAGRRVGLPAPPWGTLPWRARSLG